MKKPTTQISLRLTDTELAALDDIIAAKKFESRSSALRAGMGRLFQGHKLEKKIDLQIEKERCSHKPRRRKQRNKGKALKTILK